MQEPGLTSEAAQTMNAIRRIVQALRVGSRHAESVLGVSGAQLFAMQKLYAAPGPLSLSELATQTLTHLSSISAVVSRLVASGLVTRTASSLDARKMELTLSAKGRRLLLKANETPQERLISAIDTLAKPDQQQLATLLETVVTSAGFSESEATMFLEEEQVNNKRNAKAAKR
jgi:DNA-binding MarR family transcriptional regulator